MAKSLNLYLGTDEQSYKYRAMVLAAKKVGLTLGEYITSLCEADMKKRGIILPSGDFNKKVIDEEVPVEKKGKKNGKVTKKVG